MLTERQLSDLDPPLEPLIRLAATIVVRNAKALFLAYEAAGLAFHQRYREQPWGAHDFIVADPDGNLVHFASSPGEA